MSENTALRKKIREAIHAGKLPDRSPERTWGGSGSGEQCMICGRCVSPDDVEYEVEFATDDQRSPPAAYHAHARCFLAWESECRALDSEPPNLPASPLPSGIGVIRVPGDEREGPA
jgi:hypothetical protein